MTTTPLEQPREVFRGKIIQVLRQRMQEDRRQNEYEWAERSPGLRLLIVDGKKILLTKEYRRELQGYDLRLPGGKVFETLEEYTLAQAKGDAFILETATTMAKKEALEDAGIIAQNVKFHHLSSNGATVRWDLFYFVIDEFQMGTQQLESGEHIETVWMTFEEGLQQCLNGNVKEDRSVGVLMKFLLSQQNIS